MINEKIMCLIFGILFFSISAGAEENAYHIVKDAFDYMRGNTSTATMEMTIHRPDFTRTMVIKGWTKGDDLC